MSRVRSQRRSEAPVRLARRRDLLLRGREQRRPARLGGVPRLAHSGRELIAEGRFRLWSLDAGGATISTHLFVAAGDRQAYWLGGFDDAWAEHRPAIQVLVEAVADGIERGERLVELGPGALPYKYRLADSEELVASVELSLPDA